MLQTGDLIKYIATEGPEVLGLCIRPGYDESQPRPWPLRMLVLWFDDLEHTYEDFDVTDKTYMELVSEARQSD